MKLKCILCGCLVIFLFTLTACGSSSASDTDGSDTEAVEDIELSEKIDIDDNESDNDEDEAEEAFYWATEEDEQKDIVVNSFTCDPSEFPTGAEAKITFKADITNNTGMLLTSTNVFVVTDDGSIMGYMNDDGTDGDEVAGDSIWTLEGTCSSDEEGELVCHIMVNNIMSAKEAVLKVN